LPNNFLRVEGKLAAPLDERLSKLKNMIIEKYGGTASEIHLLGATEGLRFIYKETSYAMSTGPLGPNDGYNHPRYHWKYPNLVNQSYVALLRKHDPGALIIFAYFAVLSSEYDGIWYFHGWAQRAIAAVEETVPAEYREWLDWPKEQMELGLPAFKDFTTPPISATSSTVNSRDEPRDKGCNVEGTFMDMRLLEKARLGP
jgi:hypothetical protein